MVIVPIPRCSKWPLNYTLLSTHPFLGGCIGETLLNSNGMKLESKHWRASYTSIPLPPALSVTATPVRLNASQQLASQRLRPQLGHTGASSETHDSFNTHSCLDRCVTTAQRSEEHTVFPLLVPLQYIPNTIRTPSLEGGVSVYERLHSCLLLRTANVCREELLLFKPWSEGERRDGKSVSRQQ